MNKGFTLIELLAVIIILSLLAVLASTSSTKIVRDSKNNLYKSQIASIKSAASAWGADNPDKLPDEGKCKYFTLGDLKEYGLLDESLTNPKNSKELSDDMIIKIISKETSYGNYNITYEVDATDIDSCTFAMPICFLSDDSKVEGVEKGAKYECEVKKGTSYNFYVLSKNDDETINLIMDRNICEDGTPATEENTCLVSYNSSGDAAGVGPVTAMTYLNNATSTWKNIDNLNLTYDDEGGNFTGFKITGKTRMPYKSEVLSFNNNNGYLYENLDRSSWYYDESIKPTNDIDGILGYWTFYSATGASYVAYSVVGYGGIASNSVAGNNRGVRPVITLNRNMLYDENMK